MENDSSSVKNEPQEFRAPKKARVGFGGVVVPHPTKCGRFTFVVLMDMGGLKLEVINANGTVRPDFPNADNAKDALRKTLPKYFAGTAPAYMVRPA